MAIVKLKGKQKIDLAPSLLERVEYAILFSEPTSYI